VKQNMQLIEMHSFGMNLLENALMLGQFELIISVFEIRTF